MADVSTIAVGGRVVIVEDPADLAEIYEDDVVAAIWSRAVAALPLTPSSGRFVVDIAAIPPTLWAVRDALEVFACLTDCTTIGARWQTAERPMCPAFHTDQVELRATVSLLGPGTELRIPGTEGPVVRRTLPGDLVVMKGTVLDPVGCVHRSPPTSALRQILTLDVMAE
jgi:hypothetical protein